MRSVPFQQNDDLRARSLVSMRRQRKRIPPHHTQHLLVNPVSTAIICTAAALLHSDSRIHVATQRQLSPPISLTGQKVTRPTRQRNVQPEAHSIAAVPRPPRISFCRCPAPPTSDGPTPRIREVTISAILWSGPAVHETRRKGCWAHSAQEWFRIEEDGIHAGSQ